MQRPMYAGAVIARVVLTARKGSLPAQLDEARRGQAVVRAVEPRPLQGQRERNAGQQHQ